MSKESGIAIGTIHGYFENSVLPNKANFIKLKKYYERTK